MDNVVLHGFGRLLGRLVLRCLRLALNLYMKGQSGFCVLIWFCCFGVRRYRAVLFRGWVFGGDQSHSHTRIPVYGRTRHTLLISFSWFLCLFSFSYLLFAVYLVFLWTPWVSAGIPPSLCS
ncbi:hypothetical protein VTJ04DRAFT_9260 [Mycothermus thermophilus]|uniref:uncharacterized protein n=1 Tax=Humicola insolens TaxID=85995 RepID=UPI003742C5BF